MVWVVVLLIIYEFKSHFWGFVLSMKGKNTLYNARHINKEDFIHITIEVKLVHKTHDIDLWMVAFVIPPLIDHSTLGLPSRYPKKLENSITLILSIQFLEGYFHLMEGLRFLRLELGGYAILCLIPYLDTHVKRTIPLLGIWHCSQLPWSFIIFLFLYGW